MASCPLCGKPLGWGDPKLADGQRICSLCSATLKVKGVEPRTILGVESAQRALESKVSRRVAVDSAEAGEPGSSAVPTTRVGDSPFDRLVYQHGVPGMSKPETVALHFHGDEIVLISAGIFGKGKERVRIRLLDVIAVTADMTEQYIPAVERDRSVIGRALVGAAIAGRTGALVGGMSGVGRRTVSSAKTKKQWFVTLTYVRDGFQNVGVFKTTALIRHQHQARKVVAEILLRRQKAAQARSVERVVSPRRG